MINGFFGKYRFLSNFYPATIEFEGDRYPSSENAYQAAKVPKHLRLPFQDCGPGEAKKLGRKAAIIDVLTWDEAKLNIMELLIRDKFTRHKDLRQKLIDTGDEYLEETNNWRDVYWGVCNGKGENHLGKILMKIREEIA